MSIPTLPGVSAKTITTSRLTTRVLFSGPEDGIPVLLIHGNFSSATWWEETIVALPPKFRGIAPDQRGYGGAEPGKKIDATSGMRDFVDDALALGDLLLRARRYSEAEAAFRADLALQPGSGWALRGLQVAIAAQNRGAEAQQVQAEWARAWQDADAALRPAPRS